MTTLISSASAAIEFENDSAFAESLWSRVLGKIGSVFGKALDYLAQDMGRVDDDGEFHFSGWDCC